MGKPEFSRPDSRSGTGSDAKALRVLTGREPDRSIPRKGAGALGSGFQTYQLVNLSTCELRLPTLLILLAIGFAGCYHYPPKRDVPPKNETVVCLHGLFQTVWSMRPMAKQFAAQGYDVHVMPYFSTRYTVEEHIEAFPEKLAKLDINPDWTPVHFVTNSLGGIILRGYLNWHPGDERIGRIVMIAPPHQGSEWADKFFKVPFTPLLAWPLKELRTIGEESVKLLDSPAKYFHIGIIAGGKGDGIGFSDTLPGDDDGMVTVKSSHLEGENAHIILPYLHNSIFRKPDTIKQALHFVEYGEFLPSDTEETADEDGALAADPKRSPPIKGKDE